MVSTPIGKQAIVVGAGMGGLTAAGALADHLPEPPRTLSTSPAAGQLGKRPSGSREPAC
jgi:alpha-beta hydrolase superfamily lysophospholipase